MFGFTGTATRSGEPEKDLARARALGSSLLVFLIVPWTLCLIFYSGSSLFPICDVMLQDSSVLVSNRSLVQRMYTQIHVQPGWMDLPR